MYRELIDQGIHFIKNLSNSTLERYIQNLNKNTCEIVSINRISQLIVIVRYRCIRYFLKIDHLILIVTFSRLSLGKNHNKRVGIDTT